MSRWFDAAFALALFASFSVACEAQEAAFPPKMQSVPLYGDAAIPNSKPGPDEETSTDGSWIKKVSRPVIQIYLPAKARATGTGIVIFPGGGYAGLTFDFEGTQQAKFFIDHGIAAFVVKYRIPDDRTMVDKSMGPLQDAQQAMRFVRQHAAEWNVDPKRLGVIGFSAGGHLASTLATRLFSNELHVTKDTPPTLILHAADDRLVDVDNSVVFFEALRHAGVPVETRLFQAGEHGFYRMPRDRWQGAIMDWLTSSGWLSPRANQLHPN